MSARGIRLAAPKVQLGKPKSRLKFSRGSSCTSRYDKIVKIAQFECYFLHVFYDFRIGKLLTTFSTIRCLRNWTTCNHPIIRKAKQTNSNNKKHLTFEETNFHYIFYLWFQRLVIHCAKSIVMFFADKNQIKNQKWSPIQQMSDEQFLKRSELRPE